MKTALFPELVVNGEIIPQTVVAAEAQNHRAPKGKPGLAWREAANAIAVRTLLLQEARKRALVPEPVEVASGQFETDEEALIRGLLDDALVVEKPNEDEVKEQWNRDPSRYRSPPLWEVSHILVSIDGDDADAQRKAKVRAAVLTTFALSDPSGFAALAKRESDCPSKANGGSLGQIGPGETVLEFEMALRTLPEGGITEKPVLTRHGWHVIRMDAIAEGAVLPFDSVRSKIAEAMEKAAWAKAAHAFVNQLADAAEICGADLRSMGPKR